MPFLLLCMTNCTVEVHYSSFPLSSFLGGQGHDYPVHHLNPLEAVKEIPFGALTLLKWQHWGAPQKAALHTGERWLGLYQLCSAVINWRENSQAVTPAQGSSLGSQGQINRGRFIPTSAHKSTSQPQTHRRPCRVTLTEFQRPPAQSCSRRLLSSKGRKMKVLSLTGKNRTAQTVKQMLIQGPYTWRTQVGGKGGEESQGHLRL